MTTLTNHSELFHAALSASALDGLDPTKLGDADWIAVRAELVSFLIEHDDEPVGTWLPRLTLFDSSIGKPINGKFEMQRTAAHSLLEELGSEHGGLQWSDLSGLSVKSMKRLGGIGTKRLTQILESLVEVSIHADPNVKDVDEVDSNTPTTQAGLLAQLSASLQDRERYVLENKSFAPQSLTLAALAETLQVSRSRVGQIEQKAFRKLRYQLNQDRFKLVRVAASLLGDRLGNAFPESIELTSPVIREVLNIEPSSTLLGFYLWINGQYTLKRGVYWNNDLGTYSQLAAKLSNGAIEPEGTTRAEISRWFDDLGINSAYHEVILDSLGLHRHMGRYFITSLSAATRAYIVLSRLRRPVSIEELSEIAEFQHFSTKAMRSRLMEDDRFMRTSKDEFALRAWGLTEYSGIADAIAAEIQKAGGSAKASDIMMKLPQLFGVRASSVRAYLEAPIFVFDRELVRLRRDDEPYEVTNKLAKRTGVFATHSSVTIAIEIDSGVLRGNGQPLTPDITKALGINPGGTRVFSLRGGEAEVTVSWPITSPTGGSLGTLREVCAVCSAKLSELIRLTFDLQAGTLTAQVLNGKYSSPLEGLKDITGLNFSTPDEAEALLDEALGYPFAGIIATLKSRGDTLAVEYLYQLGIYRA